MQAEKLALQGILVKMEGERDGAFAEVRRLSVTMDGIVPNARLSTLDQQMKNPIAVKEQYTLALEQIRHERDVLEQHRSELDERERLFAVREVEHVEAQEQMNLNIYAHRLAVTDESQRLAQESRARNGNLRKEADLQIGKYSKRRRSNVAVIIVRIDFISSFLFYCLFLNHSFSTNPNRITNCFQLIFLYLQLYKLHCSCFPAILIF